MNRALQYQGTSVNIQDDRLNMTDMWKASGSTPNKEPAQWLRLKQAQEFIQRLETAMGIPHSGLVGSDTGGVAGGGATWAHWQIGFAYAKYLSADFHIWCNTVVRAYMEGRSSIISANNTGRSDLTASLAAVDRIEKTAMSLASIGTISEERAQMKVVEAMKLYLGFDLTTPSTMSFDQPKGGLTVYVPAGSGAVQVKPVPNRDGHYYMSQWLNGDKTESFNYGQQQASKNLQASLTDLFKAQGREINTTAGQRKELGRIFRSIGVWPYLDDLLSIGGAQNADWTKYCKDHLLTNPVERNGEIGSASKTQEHAMFNLAGIEFVTKHINDVLIPKAPEEAQKRLEMKRAADKNRREAKKAAKSATTNGAQEHQPN